MSKYIKINCDEDGNGCGHCEIREDGICINFDKELEPFYADCEHETEIMGYYRCLECKEPTEIENKMSWIEKELLDVVYDKTYDQYVVSKDIFIRKLRESFGIADM